jgi:hypothetical protein
MDAHSDTQKHGLWNRFSNNVAAQVITTLVVAAVLIWLAAKYVW